MKIIHVVENLNRGGLERVVVDLSKEQIRNGHQVLIICLFSEGELENEAIKNGCEVVALDKAKGFDIYSVIKLRNLITGYNGDVIHTHNPVSNYFTSISLIMTSLPIINTRHGMGDHKKSLKRELFYKISLLRTKMVVAVCNEARENFIKNSIVTREKSTVVKNGINIQLYSEPDVSIVSELKEELGLNTNCIVFGTVGRLISYKNHLALIDAFTTLDPEVVLIIVGGGELFRDINAKVESLGLSDRVKIMGDQDNVPDYLELFDIFIMPSMTEGYSLSLLEACAAKLPVLCTNVGGNKEIVEHKFNGLLLDGYDSESIHKGVCQILQEDYGLMGKRGFEWVSEFGTTEKVYSDYMECYNQVFE